LELGAHSKDGGWERRLDRYALASYDRGRDARWFTVVCPAASSRSAP